MDSKVSIYCYASGEKDSAIAFIANYEEVIAVILEPFTGKLKTEYVTINPDEDYDEQIEKMHLITNKKPIIGTIGIKDIKLTIKK